MPPQGLRLRPEDSARGRRAEAAPGEAQEGDLAKAPIKANQTKSNLPRWGVGVEWTVDSG
jgi:hypothetical protein